MIMPVAAKAMCTQIVRLGQRLASIRIQRHVPKVVQGQLAEGRAIEPRRAPRQNVGNVP